MLKRVAFFASVLFLIGLISSPFIAAQQEELIVEYESVNPEDAYRYTFKRLREKIILALLSPAPERKANYYEKLLAVRLAELKYVVDNKDIAYIQTASQRYSATAGQLTEFILKKGLSERKEKIKELLASHLPVLEDLMDTYNDTTAEWRFVKHDADYLQIYISQLSN